MKALSQTPRWHLLDLLRVFCFIHISQFHLGLFYFGTPQTGFVDQSLLINLIDASGRTFAISGFVIALMSSFLLAQSTITKQKKQTILGVLLFGWIYLAFDIDGSIFSPWDVFSTLFVAFATLFLAQKLHQRGLLVLGLVGFGLLWIPFWRLGSRFSPELADLRAILGLESCGAGSIIEWPLLPWVGLIWFGFWLGCEAKSLLHKEQESRLRLSLAEIFCWILVLALSIPQLGAYRSIRVGPYFACDAYQQEPLIFWSHFIWALLIVRLALDARVQGFLAGQRWAVVISKLAMSRKFWVAYIVQFVLIGLVVEMLYQWEEYDPESFARFELPILEWSALTLMFQIELATRLVIKTWTRLRPRLDLAT